MIICTFPADMFLTYVECACGSSSTVNCWLTLTAKIGTHACTNYIINNKKLIGEFPQVSVYSKLAVVPDCVFLGTCIATWMEHLATTSNI